MALLRLLQIAVMIAVDLAAYYTALILAILFRTYIFPWLWEYKLYYVELYWDHLELWWIPVTIILTMAYESLYQKRLPVWEEVRHQLKALTVAFVVVFAFVSLGKFGGQISRILLLSLWLGLMVLAPIYRSLGKKLMRLLGIWHDNVLILGAGEAGLATLKGLEREVTLGYRVIGFLDDDPAKIGSTFQTVTGQYRVFGAIRNFKKFATMMNISTIIIALPSMDPAQQTQLVSEVQRYVPRVLFVPDIKGIALLNTELQVLFMEQLFLLKIRNNLKSLHARIIKRCFDFFISSLVLLAFSPILLAVYIAVRLTSRGGAFFFQFRPGKNGKVIRIYKFRTMHVDGDARLAKAIAEDENLAREWQVFRKLKTYDPRLTPIGKFLRKWSLDELPQIFNVWKGEMSIVGPRPYMINELPTLKEAQDVILMAKPGLCGLWQASGRNNISFEDRVKLESWYVLNWSLWLDLILMVKTAKVVFTAEGAY
jgi:Undecaprenyl-phosphate galactose phosphotransferase WbaP